MSNNNETVMAEKVEIDASTLKALLAKVEGARTKAVDKASTVGEKDFTVTVAHIAYVVYALSLLMSALAVFNIVDYGPAVAIPTFSVTALGTLYGWVRGKDEN